MIAVRSTAILETVTLAIDQTIRLYCQLHENILSSQGALLDPLFPPSDLQMDE